MANTFTQIENRTYDTNEIVTPSDRTFRRAWAAPLDGVVSVDMDQAREIWRDKIRTARTSVLAGLDADFMKALEAGDTALQADISAQKQALRDAPADLAITMAETPEELMLVQPAGLKLE